MSLPDESTIVTQIQFFQKKREQIFAKVQKTYDLSKNVSPGSVSRFLARCTELEYIKQQFELTQDNLLKLNVDVSSDKQDTQIDSSNDSFDELFFSIKTIELELRGKLYQPVMTGPSATQSPGVDEIRLAKVEVPTWSGDLLGFKNYWSMFNSMVHNSKHSDVIKLTYLRKSLQGAPLELIQNLDISAENYSVAYRMIESRYGNLRSLAACYVDKMLDFAPLRATTSKDLETFLATFRTTYKAFMNLDIENHEDFILFQCALRALPTQFRTLFERQIISLSSVPTFDVLIKFVEDQLKIEELNQRSGIPVKTTQSGKVPVSRKSQSLLAVSPDSQNPGCPVCDGACETIYACERYRKDLSPRERFDKMAELRRCFKCLGSHNKNSCKSKGRCRFCKSAEHHSSLHDMFDPQATDDQTSVSVADKSKVNSKSDNAPSVIASASSVAIDQTGLTYPPISTSDSAETQTLFTEGLPSPAPRTVLLATVQALILNKWGRLEPIRIVLDPGSQISLITAECCQRLSLPSIAKVTHISGASAQNIGVSKSVVNCKLYSRLPNSPVLSSEAVVVNKVCAELPSSSVSEEVYNRFSHLNLADRVFHTPGKIDFLLGAALFPEIFPDKPAIISGEPAALETIFGFVIMGNVPNLPLTTPAVSLFITESDVDKTLRSFWEVEDVPHVSVVDPMHKYAEEHFVATHSRRPDGSYQVRLPFKPGSNPQFVNSLPIARRRWFNLEKRLLKNETLKRLYVDFLIEYEELGHMCLTKELGEFYIPHFGILKDSATSPLRVVFDASCQDASGKSLNDCLVVGPPLQKDIAEVITMFRLHPYAITTDIKMMYRKIWLHPDDTKFQHIVWRRSEVEPLSSYALQTVTYGTSFAPFAAQRVLIQLVEDHGHHYPLASQVILKSCYMDDVCCSVEDIVMARQLKTELIDLMKAGGFELRKWASNSPDLLEDIPLEHQITSLSWDSPESASLHILGVSWDPLHDVFSYSVKPVEMATSKRQVSSQIGSLYDPLGWISPVIFLAKRFLREIWECQLDWDTKLPYHIQSRWAAFSSQLPSLAKIEFPRLLLDPDMPHVQLIGFADASTLGYAATIYLRCSSADGKRVSVKLLRAKTKVAPLKVMTVPRLELNGALLLANLLHSIKPILEPLRVKETFLLTDSAVVLAWLRTPPHHLQTYVANRVVAISEQTELGQWHHVQSSSNAADVPSRGLYPQEIVDHPTWWSGPEFLYHPLPKWPMEAEVDLEELPELKKKAQALLTAPRKRSKNLPLVISVIEKYSSLHRLKRVMAWVLRFIKNCQQHGPRKTSSRTSGPLQPEELRSSMLVCVKATQQHYLKAELTALAKGRKIPPLVARLSPFLMNGILRVGGRLHQSLLSPDAKHPYLLPKQAHLSAMICEAYHRRLMHAGPQACQAAIVQDFWIMSLRGLLRRRIFKCNLCFRHRVKQDHPLMADLPSARVRPCRPFTQSAVDMAGPFTVKASNLRSTPKLKAYMCIFVCMATKAVHIELCSDLSTECFVGALTRFVSRRGMCSDIYCDNGTNFSGACNEAKTITEFLCKTHPEVADHLAASEIRYHFNPPEAPWMGGLWEAAVKSAKRHLRDLSSRLFTYEEMSTILTRVEAILNSRPLCPVGDSPDSIYLSPGHFLTGGPLLSPLEYDLSDEPTNHLSRWQAVQQASQRFWKLWTANYLHTLMERPKWTTPKPPLQIGDIVIILRAQTRPLDWPLGRVIELHHGADGIPRSATVKTAHGTYQRPVAKLAVLPLAEDA